MTPGHVYDLIQDKLSDWLELAVQMLPNFLVALLLFLAFVALGKMLRRLFERLMLRLTDNESLRDLLGSSLYLAVLSVGLFISLSVLKLDGAVASLLAGAGIISLALGFAFQEIASNFIAGIMMSIRKPFREGDLIETNGFYGTVLKIHLRTTDLKTLQGQYVMIPNAEVFKKPIQNYSRTQRRRIDLPVGVHYKTNLDLAQRVARESVEALSGVEPGQVLVFYTDFGSSSINMVVQIWLPFANAEKDFLSLRHQAIMAIKKGFDAHGITIPFPMRTLDFGEVNFPQVFRQAGLSAASSDEGDT